MFKKMNKIGKVFLGLGIGIILFFIIFSGVGKIVFSPSAEAVDNQFYNHIRLFSEVLSLIQEKYVEKVDIKDLIYGAASGMVKTLDCFSQFMDPDEYREMKVETKGEFGGLGIRIAIKDNYLTIITPLPGTPAYRKGILPGDKIIKVGDEDIKDITLMEAVKKLRGPKGTKVTITIFREGEKEPLEFTIIRDIIKIESVRWKMMEDSIGYIHLLDFTENALEGFDKALSSLGKKGMKSFILDLRNNPGGLLTVSVDVVKRFIAEEKLIVYTEGRESSQEMKFFADNKKRYAFVPMVVLVNKGSASASEIVAGAIQDWKRGVILGVQTFGKGSVQTVIPLSDGSALRLTTAKYYTPKGRCIHDVGITPDIVVPISRELEIKLMTREEDDLIEKLNKKTNKKTNKKEKEEKIEDVQLNRAIDILKAREFFLIPSSMEKTKKNEKKK